MGKCLPPIENNHEIKCVITLKLIIYLLLSYISNVWQLLYMLAQIFFSLYVRALNMIKRCNFLQPLGNLFLFPPHFCVAVINSDTNSANSRETCKYIEKSMKAHVGRALEGESYWSHQHLNVFWL